MEIFETSCSWIMALGKAILHSIWLGFLILSLLKLLFMVIPERHADRRYIAAVGALFLLVVSAGLFFVKLYQPATGSAHGMATSGLRTVNFQEILPLITFLYLSGLALMLLRAIWLIRSNHRIRRQGRPAGAQWEAICDRLRRQLGIRRKTGLVISGEVTAPGTTGFLRPVILLPASLLTHLPAEQLEFILIHELYHIRRWDHLINLFQVLAETLLFFHPAVWIISAMVRSEREHCIDDRVLQWCSRPVLYTKALFRVASEGKRLALLQQASGRHGKHELLQRIQRIHNNHIMKQTYRTKLHAFGFFLAGILILTAVLSFSPGRPVPPVQGMIEQQTDTIPWSPGAEEPSSPDLITTSPPAEPASPEAGSEPSLQEPSLQEPPVQEPSLQEPPVREPPQEPDAIRKELEKIDWEEIRSEVERGLQEARKEMEETDWEELMEEAGKGAEAARREIENIDWDAMKAEIEKDLEITWKEMEEIDWEEIQAEARKGAELARREIENIDWEEISREMERTMVKIDSLLRQR